MIWWQIIRRCWVLIFMQSKMYTSSEINTSIFVVLVFNTKKALALTGKEIVWLRIILVPFWFPPAFLACSGKVKGIVRIHLSDSPSCLIGFKWRGVFSGSRRASTWKVLCCLIPAVIQFYSLLKSWNQSNSLKGCLIWWCPASTTNYFFLPSFLAVLSMCQ